MPSVVFTKQYSTGTYTPEMRVRISYSESYNSSTKKTTVTLTDVELYSSVMFSTIGMPLFGKVKFNGTVVADFEGGSSDTVAMTDSYSSADYSGSYGSVTVTHNADGTASVSIGVDVGENWSASDTFGAWPYTYDSGHIYGVDAPDSTTVSLTTHRPTYTVAYNANGGTGAPSSQTKTYNVNLTLSSTVPTRTGYDFLGWSTSSTATTATYSAGGTYTANAGATLYAVWRLKTYTISYNANGGSGAPSSQTKTYGVNLTLSSTVPTKTGYDFLGWSKSSTATTATYSAGGTYTANEAATLYAVWRLKTYTVSYNANSGSGAPSSQTKTYGITLTLSSIKPTRAAASAGSYTVTYSANSGSVSPASATAARTTSYSFSKWNTAANGSGTNYSPGGSYTANAAATLYAQWTSSTTTASVTLPTPTRSGFSFKGWYTASSGGTKIGNAGASYTPTGNVTIHAQWTALASTISSYTSSVATQGTFTLSVSRNNSAYYHKATFKIGSTTLATSAAFATTLNYTVPRTWFNNYGSQTSLTVTASVQTYTTSACTTAVGSPATTSFTVTADSGMKPSVASGWVTAAAYNTGVVSGMTGYIKGYSRATVTFNTSKITNAAGASISTYSITCQGTTDSTSPYQTPVLTSTSVPVTCKITDTRGRSASGTLTLSVYDYAKPSLSNISVFRCTANGTASEDGTYYSVKATSAFSSLNGQNSCTIKVSHAQSGGSFGTEYTLTSGTARVIGSLSVDKSYTVRIIATDSLGNSVTYTSIIPTRSWAMKFRPDGNGVAFGKAAELDSTFDVSSEWDVKFGKPLAVASGGTGATTVSGAPFVRKVISTNDVYVSASYDNDQPIAIWQNNADNSQRFGLVVAKTYIGLYDTNNSSWVWRTPIMTQPLGAWQINQGGTGGTTASAARTNLNVPSVSDLTAAQYYTINGVNFIFRRYGKVVVCTTDGAITNAASTSAYMGNAQVADTFKPISAEIRYIQVTPSHVLQFNLNTNGLFQVGYASSTISAGVALRGTFVYIAAG